MSTLSPESFRELFPMLASSTHLASCSQGARSTELDLSLTRMMETIADQGAPWGLWMDEVERARSLFARSINASPSEIALVPNASVGAYQVASTLDYAERPGIVSTDMEFPSVAHVWLAQRPRGATVTFASEADGHVDAAEYAKLIDQRTNLVSAPLVSYKNGARLPISDIVGQAHEAGARVFIDAYQAAGVVPIDVKALNCDYLVTGTLKYMLGLPGLAFLYVRDGVADQVNPQLTGWFARVDPFEFDPRSLDFADDARRMETGTPSIPSVYAANAGMRVLEQRDVESAWTYIQARVAETATSIEELGYEIYSPREGSARGPQVAVRTPDPERLGAFLHERRIFASPRGEVVRLSFQYYNTEADVEACVSAFADYRSA